MRALVVLSASRRALDNLILITAVAVSLVALLFPRPLGERAYASAVEPDPWFSLRVEPIDEPLRGEPGGKKGVNAATGSNTPSAWRLTYRVENRSPHETMKIVSVADSFAAALELVAVGTVYSPGVSPGLVDVWNEGLSHSSSFKWEGFELKPGEWAQLVIELVFRKEAGGKRLPIPCGRFQLNAQGMLRYTLGGRSGLIERQARPIEVEIPCPSFLDVQLNTKVTWFIRMPGDYYARAVDGTVAASHPVYITFSGFDHLKNANNGQTLPVFYALNEEQPQGWLTPDELNATTLFLPTDGNELRWNLWQRVVLDGQSAGTYTDTGVITFTLRNVEDAQF